MSVILDALKRVQEEDRNTGRTSARAAQSPAAENDALVRRLAAGPSAPRNEAPMEISRAGRVGLLVLSLLAIVAVVSWAFEPRLGSLQPADDRPLLSDLTGARRPATNPAERSAPVTTVDPDTDEGTLFEEFIATPTAAAANRTAQDLRPAATADEPPMGGRSELAAMPQARDNSAFADLSGNLPAAPAPTAGAGEASANGEGFIRLSSDYEAPAETSAQNDRDVIVLDGQDASADRAPQALVDPGVRAAFQDGVRMQKAGDYAGAEEAYKRALKFDPYNAKVNANLGVLYETQSRLSLAERHLRQAVDIAPDNANAHNNLGVVLYRVGNYDGALIEFNRTLALDPGVLDAYTNKGLIFTRWGRHEDAERAFMQVLARDPENSLAHYNLGLVYEDTDQIARAVNHYYDFLSTGGAQHPEIVDYLAEHLPWLEARLESGNDGVSR